MCSGSSYYHLSCLTLTPLLPHRRRAEEEHGLSEKRPAADNGAGSGSVRSQLSRALALGPVPALREHEDRAGGIQEGNCLIH